MWEGQWKFAGPVVLEEIVKTSVHVVHKDMEDAFTVVHSEEVILHLNDVGVV